jgi:hypothetical protein
MFIVAGALSLVSIGCGSSTDRTVPDVTTHERPACCDNAGWYPNGSFEDIVEPTGSADGDTADALSLDWVRFAWCAPTKRDSQLRAYRRQRSPFTIDVRG